MKLKRRKECTFLSSFGIFLTVSLCVAVPLETEFYGADEHKIREKPEYLKVCHQGDKNLDKCIKSSLEKFMESMNSGSDRFNLPSIDPIELPFLSFQQGSGNVSVHITFKDFTIVGFRYFKIMSVKSNIIDNKFEISIDSPFINMMADYTAEGGIYTFPIVSQSDFRLNLTDVSIVLILHLTKTTNLPGLSYLSVEESLVDLLPTEITGYFGEFIDGSNVISSAFNTFFNRNAHEIFSVLKPNLSRILANVFKSIANEILSRHPDDVLLPL